MMVVAVVFFALGLVFVSKSSALDDSTLPQITAFSLSPTTVDTATASRTVTATITLTDAQSGVSGNGAIDLSAATGTQFRSGTYTRISGDQFNGVYTATMTLPMGSKDGVWNVSQLAFSDNVGNMAILHKNDLETLFGTGVASITNTATTSDSIAPQITAFSLSPATINTQSASQTVTATMTVTDDQSGATDQPEILLAPAGSSQTGDALFHRISGDGLSGTYQATITIPRGAKNGVWPVGQLALSDNVGNQAILHQSDLEALFGAGVASITNTATTADTTGPQITAFSLTPIEINTENASQQVTVTFTITDDQAGARTYGEIMITPLIGTQTGDVIFNRVSGDDFSGVYTATITLPKGAKEGVWQVAQLAIFDLVGNLTMVGSDQLSVIPGATGVTLVNTAAAQSVTIDRKWTLNSANGYMIFPTGTVVTRKEGGSFAFYQMLAASYDVTARTANGRRQGVVGTLRTGVPGLDLNFSQPVTIALAVDDSLNGRRLRIQSLDEGGIRWADESQCVVSDGYCSFTVMHATYFMATTDISGLLPGTLPNTGRHHANYKP